MSKLDIRPRCISCGRRWMPPEGVDAQTHSCPECIKKAQRPFPRFKDPAHPDKWWITDFTLEQVDRRLKHLEQDAKNLTMAIKKICYLDNAMLNIMTLLREAQFECQFEGGTDEEPVTCRSRDPFDRSMWCPDCFALSIIAEHGDEYAEKE